MTTPSGDIVTRSLIRDLTSVDSEFEFTEQQTADRLADRGWTASTVEAVTALIMDWHPTEYTSAGDLYTLRRGTLVTLGDLTPAAVTELAQHGGGRLDSGMLYAAIQHIPLPWLGRITRAYWGWAETHDWAASTVFDSLADLRNRPYSVWHDFDLTDMSAMPDALGWLDLAIATAQQDPLAADAYGAETFEWDRQCLGFLALAWDQVDQPWVWHAAGFGPDEARAVLDTVDTPAERAALVDRARMQRDLVKA